MGRELTDVKITKSHPMNYLAKLENQNKSFLILVGVTLIGVIGGIDFLTGYEFSFSVFYVLPIALITWLTSNRVGLLASVASAIVWYGADEATGHPYTHPLIPIWNTLIRLAFFVIITLLLSAFKQALQRESELARTDHLTGAVNSRFFYELAGIEIDRFRRYGHPFTIAYFDLDNFKGINDQFGHATGDQVLCVVASSIRKQIRKTDIFARLGGDEFAMLLPETNEESTRLIFPKIHTELQNELRRNNWQVTCSIGVVICKVTPDSAEELIKQADSLMYLAKNDGKNRIKYDSYSREQETSQ